MQEMQVTLVQSLDWEDPLEEGIATTPVFLPGKSPQTEEPGRLVHGVADTTEQLSTHSISRTRLGLF